MAACASGKVIATYSNCAKMVHDEDFPVMLLEPKSFRTFASSEQYLFAMKEDLAEWLNQLYSLNLDVDNFLKRLETGVILCK